MSFTLAYSIIIPTLSLVALLYAGIEDILFREVRREIIWLLMVVFGLILDALYIIFSPNVKDAVLEILLNVVIGFLLGFILFYAGVWGGADTKALWAISILAPVHPFSEGIIMGHQSIPVISSMVFSLLINAGILTIFYPIILLIINTIFRIKGPLFDEVQGSATQKLRCFLFGYRKKIKKIDPKKFHYMFLEQKMKNNFEGTFEGDFTGRLDGKFIGYFHGNISGDFTGKIVGKFDKKALELEKNDLETILNVAKRYSQMDLLKTNDYDEAPTPVLEKYREDYGLKDIEVTKSNLLINTLGRIKLPIDGYFCGLIDGVFDGTINGTAKGNIEGDYLGNSSKGKISGTTLTQSDGWYLNIKTRLEDEYLMEKNQFRTLWQLRKSNKKTVWVMPGIPFVFLMFLGYILYLLFGNIVLLLFTI